MIKPWAQSILRCPSSQEPLNITATHLVSSQYRYPMLKNIPWLFADPDFSYSEWATKIQNHVEDEQLQLKHLQQHIESANNSLTKSRLQKQHEARHKNLAQLKKTLAPFFKEPKTLIRSSTQQIHSYFRLLFRDWCWQADELKTYVDYCKAKISDKACRILLMGCGAGGLSYRLANELPQANIISIEHNPFLALTSQHILEGKSLKLYDFSEYPKSLNETSQKWNIKTEKLTTDNHQIILSAFPHLPFEPQSFDVIIAPWFLDILDIPFNNALTSLITFLKTEGKFVFFGPANIHKQNMSEQFCFEEIEMHIKQYFKQFESHTADVYYMNSPIDSQQRQENLLFVTAHEVSQRQDLIHKGPAFQDITYTPALEKYKLMLATHQQILSHINRDMSYRELGDILVKNFGFEKDEAEIYAVAFIKQMIQQAK